MYWKFQDMAMHHMESTQKNKETHLAKAVETRHSHTKTALFLESVRKAQTSRNKSIRLSSTACGHFGPQSELLFIPIQISDITKN